MKNFETFRINTPAVVYEVFDQEVVVIHLESGNYYTLDQSGAQIWHFLQQGVTPTAMIDRLTEQNQGSTAAVAEIVRHFLHKLQQEQLIVPSMARSESPVTLAACAPWSAVKQATLFQAPALRKYTDMQDLLLLDPIHDVKETGWPNAKGV